MSKAYDVCLSFAGEDRRYVEEVAGHLREQNVTVFYDKYEQVDLWGKDLYQHLDSIYRTQATYCVIFISAAYAAKMWTRHELRAAQARAFTENSEYILPARFDHTELPGIPPTIGYVDLTSLPPRDLASLIVSKLQRIDGRSTSSVARRDSGTRDMARRRPVSDSVVEGHLELVKCARCAGTGTRDRDGRGPKCRVCGGIGAVKLRRQPGEFTTCAFCTGDGTRDRDGRDPLCPVCKGIGGYFVEAGSMSCGRCAGTGSRDRDRREPLCELCSGRGYITPRNLREY